MRPPAFARLTAALGLLATPAWAQSSPQPRGSEWAQAAVIAQESARAAQEIARSTGQAVKEALKEVERQQWSGEPRGESFSGKLSKVLKAENATAVIVQNFAGDITVTTGAAGQVKVEATKRARGRDGSEDQAALDQARVNIEEHAGRIEISAWTPKHQGRVAIDFAIALPPSPTLELKVKSMSGDISLTGVKGPVFATTMSGDINATALSSASSLKTVSGDVVLTSSAVAGELSAGSVSGDVSASELKVKVLNAGTVSGNVVLRNAGCDQATVQTVSGNLEVAGPLRKSARYEIKSHSGDVRILVDGKTGFELDASTWSGEIANDFGIKAEPQPEGGTPALRHKTLKGMFGDGSAQIEVSSFSGNVTVVKLK